RTHPGPSPAGGHDHRARPPRAERSFRMQTFPRIAATALSAALLLAIAACNKPGKDAADEGKPAAAADAKADPDAVPGLPTEKDRNSYMIGMALARQFEPMKDQIDVDVVVKALKASLAGEKTL